MIAITALLCVIVIGAIVAPGMALRALRRDPDAARRPMSWLPWFGAVAIAIAPAHATPARPGAVEVVEVMAQPAIVRTIRARPAALGRALESAIFTLVAESQRRRLDIAGPPFARYVSRGTARDPMMVVDVGLPVAALPEDELGDGTRSDVLRSGPAARVVFRGRHDQLSRAHATLDAWLDRSQRVAAGPRWEVYVTNPLTTKEADQQTQVFVPLTVPTPASPR